MGAGACMGVRGVSCHLSAFLVVCLSPLLSFRVVLPSGWCSPPPPLEWCCLTFSPFMGGAVFPPLPPAGGADSFLVVLPLRGGTMSPPPSLAWRPCQSLFGFFSSSSGPGSFWTLPAVNLALFWLFSFLGLVGPCC